MARQGTFRSAQGGQGESGSAAVRCVLRSDDGHLFCLNKVFFFLPKPPTLIRYDEVEQARLPPAGRPPPLSEASHPMT